VIRYYSTIGTFVFLFSNVLFASETDLNYVDRITEFTRSCSLQGIKLALESPGGLTEPTYGGEPLYGTLPLAGEAFSIALDRSPDGGILYVDTDRTGVLEEVEWERRLWGGGYLASVPFQVRYDDTTPSAYRLFLIWNPLYPTVLIYCRDSYREGVIRLGETTYRIAVIDEDTDGRYDNLSGGALLIDLDRDGDLLTTMDSHERYMLNEPFNVDGTVYRVTTVAPDGSHIEIEVTDEWVAAKPLLEVGYPAPLFDGINANGREISLSSLRGSIVLLDFWASWCAPCIWELPTLKELTTEFAGNGLVVLGINLDRSKGAFDQTIIEYALTYPQIYDGVEGPIASLYRIAGIPMTYLIDRKGIIHGKGLRGEDLRQAIETLLSDSP